MTSSAVVMTFSSLLIVELGDGENPLKPKLASALTEMPVVPPTVPASVVVGPTVVFSSWVYSEAPPCS